MSNTFETAGARFDQAKVNELMQRGRIERSRAFWAVLAGLGGLIRSLREAITPRSGRGAGPVRT